MADTDYDIVIAGAGIAGSALALAVAETGLDIAIIEPNTPEPLVKPPSFSVLGFDRRVSALTPAARDFLRELNVWDAIADYRLCAYDHMTVWDADGTGRIEFDAAEVDVATLGYIVENGAVVDALHAALDGARRIDLLAGASVTGVDAGSSGPVKVELDNGDSLGATLVVAADGALSRIRELLNFKTREWDYGHRAIVATVQLERAHQHTAWQRFLSSGPLALLPLPDDGSGHFCSLVWSAEDELADSLLALEDSDFCAALGSASEYCLGDVVACSPRVGFPLRQRHAVSYVQPGVALVADAAHTIHPLAGQGINLGLQDVAVLAKEIRRAVRLDLDAGSTGVLERYQRQRKADNLVMMGAMDGFKRLFGETALPVRWLRNVGMRAVDGSGPLKAELMRRAMGIT